MLLVPIDRLLSVTGLKLPTYTMHHYTVYYTPLQLKIRNITYSLNHQKLTLFIYTHMNQEHKGFSVFWDGSFRKYRFRSRFKFINLHSTPISIVIYHSQYTSYLLYIYISKFRAWKNVKLNVPVPLRNQRVQMKQNIFCAEIDTIRLNIHPWMSQKTY